MIKLSQYVVDFLANKGLKNLFLLPGGGCMHLLDSFGRCHDIQKICCLHEQAAVIAADACSQYTDDFGVALVTTGPGSTNAITGVAGAWIDSIPMLVLSGQVKRQDMIGNRGVRQMGIQEVDIISMVKPITKYACTVMEPEEIRYHLEKAFYLAKGGRPGPVWLDIPLDVQGAMIDEKNLEPFIPEEQDFINRNALKKLVDQTIEYLNQSKRPVLMVGNGVRLSHALKEFYQLIDMLNIPVLTTWKSIDFLPEDHPLYFGRPGSIGQRYANFIQQNSDYFLTIGARLDLAQIGYYYQNVAREAKKVVIDIDVAEIDKMEAMNVDLKVASDAKVFIEMLLAKKNKIKKKDRKSWFNQCRSWKEKYPVILPEYQQNKFVNTYILVDALSQMLDENDVIIPGSSGSCSEILLQAFKVKKGQRIFNNPGLGSMGYGLPASMGACVVSGRRTIAVIGDGGLQHNIQELETIHRLQLPLKIFILNNNGYASIRNTQRNHFDGNLVCCDPSSGLTIPDICAVASAYKIAAVKIKNHSELNEKLKIILNEKGPVICDVLVNPDLITAPRLSSEVQVDGSIVSKPLEDLCPFLDRDEFRKNMFINPIKEN